MAIVCILMLIHHKPSHEHGGVGGNRTRDKALVGGLSRGKPPSKGIEVVFFVIFELRRDRVVLRVIPTPKLLSEFLFGFIHIVTD